MYFFAVSHELALAVSIAQSPSGLCQSSSALNSATTPSGGGRCKECPSLPLASRAMTGGGPGAPPRGSAKYRNVDAVIDSALGTGHGIVSAASASRNGESVNEGGILQVDHARAAKRRAVVCQVNRDATVLAVVPKANTPFLECPSWDRATKGAGKHEVFGPLSAVNGLFVSTGGATLSHVHGLGCRRLCTLAVVNTFDGGLMKWSVHQCLMRPFLRSIPVVIALRVVQRARGRRAKVRCLADSAVGEGPCHARGGQE